MNNVYKSSIIASSMLEFCVLSIATNSLDGTNFDFAVLIYLAFIETSLNTILLSFVFDFYVLLNDIILFAINL
jgi:hypothetical protein